ncbi:MAG: D-alanyl-D-alanine carboxypeptidase (penicillin-binding protein 5/6), partial [Halioglobus sp.]
MVFRFMTRFSLVLLLVLMPALAHSANIVPAPPQLGAKAYILIDASTGEVLVESDADMPLPPASLTKLMTSYVLASEIA